MNKQFKQWATACRLAADQGVGNVDDLRKLADFLQSLADMPDDEPDERQHMHWIAEVGGNTTPVLTVTKTNRDWHRKQHLLSVVEVMALTEMLDAKDALIKELEISLNLTEDAAKKGETARLVLSGMELGQSPRPILKDQPEVFDALKEFIVSAIEDAIAPSNKNCTNYVSAETELRKLLVGDSHE